MIEVVEFTKNGGPLTKRIGLGADGTLCSDGSACVMAKGAAQRVRLPNLHSFGRLLDRMTPDKAIGLGTLRHDLPDEVEITTKSRLNGPHALHLIARTNEYIVYRPGQPALALIDVDTKGMPAAVRDRIEEIGGFWPALVSVMPELETAGRVARKSTSAGLSRTDTGERLPGSNGEHVFLLVTDGTDTERFFRTMHDRCWLHGFGWLMVGAGGQLLDRSFVDRMVFGPERLVFEGAPVLEPPLAQDKASRRPIVTVGAALDTSAACPPLRIVEQAKLREMRAKDAHRLAPDRAAARKTFITAQATRIAERTGCSVDAARRTVERQCDGVLLSDIALPFDAPELAGSTVGDVLTDPERFVGETLADPLEGVAYGANKAVVMRRADGTPWIFSFAHGRTDYELRHGAAAIEAILRDTADADLLATFVRLEEGLDAHDRQRLRDVVSPRTGVGVRAIYQAVKDERARAEARQKEADVERRAAERLDPRPALRVPADDAPWLPQIETINDVLSASAETEPPARDIDGVSTRLKLLTIPLLHLLQPTDDNT